MSTDPVIDPALRGWTVLNRVRDPELWWRPDGTRPARGESTEGLIPHDPKHYEDDGELRAVRALQDAIKADDYSNFDALVDAADKAEADLRKRMAAKAKRDEARRAKGEAQSKRISELVDGGMEEDEATSLVTGEPVEWIRKNRYMSQQPGWDGTVAGFNEAVKSEYLGEVLRLMQQAEDETGGEMVKRKFRDKIPESYLFLTESESIVRQYATDEMKEWFDAAPNRRPLLSEFRDRILGTSTYRRRDDYLQ